MVLPLNEVQTKKHMAPKPGYIKDDYIRVQNINNAVDACEQELDKEFVNVHTKQRIFGIIDKWLKVKK